MDRSKGRGMNKIRIAGAAAGVVLVSGVVLQVSSAAFTDTTDNAGNSWEAGTVYLSDSKNGTAMFSSTSMNIVPGYTETRCMTVTYDGSVNPSAAIAFDTTLTENLGDGAGSNGLADDLDVTLTMGPAGSVCLNDQIVAAGQIVPLVGNQTTQLHNGDLKALADAAVKSTWTPDAEGGADLTRPFQFTVSMPGGAATPNDAQGDTAKATFSWSSTAGS